MEETHQHSDGSCLVPSAPRRCVPRVTREDCRSCREGCSAGGVSLGNTTIVSLRSVQWHLETFRAGERGRRLSLNTEVCQGLAPKDREQTSQPSIIAMVAVHHEREQVCSKWPSPTSMSCRVRKGTSEPSSQQLTLHTVLSSPLCRAAATKHRSIQTLGKKIK